ncbi:MAG: carbohydrate ABC transporter permease [Lachnospiraceae bacterium]|nr:carbohydrate ABC transporter permease [Lachnospiraceae bacterium]
MEETKTTKARKPRKRKYESLEYAPSMIAKKCVWYGILIAMAIAFVAPIMFMFFGTFKTSQELARVPFDWLPDHWRLDNIKTLFTKLPFFLYLRNTLIIVFFNIVGSLVSNSLVAYGFSRIEWPGRDKVFILVIITMILPFQVVMVPLYLLFSKLKWIGTFLPLTLTCFFGNSFYIFLLRQFLVGIPQEISSAAKIDGSGEFRIFWQLTLPLCKPALATVGIFAFIRSWNDYIGPLIFLPDSKLFTLSLAISKLKSNLDPQWPLLMSAGTLMVLPVLLLFFVLQQYFIQGVTMSGIKG